MDTNGSNDAKPLGGSQSPKPSGPNDKPPITPSSSSSQGPIPIQPTASGPSKPSSESTIGPTGETQDKWRNATSDYKPHESRDEPKKDHHESMEDKVRDTFRNMRDSKKVDELYDYARHNKEQTIIYVLLIVGLLVLFFNNILGGLIIGMVAGYYFADEIVYYIRNLGQIVSGQDQLRYVTLTAVLLGLFISAPGIFIGAAIVAAFKQVMMKKD